MMMWQPWRNPGRPRPHWSGRSLPCPKEGPSLFSVGAFQNLSITAATTVGPERFRWPRALFVTGVLVLPQSGAESDSALLSVQIQDEQFSDIIFDGQGGAFEAPGLALSGRGFKFFPLQRPVLDGDEWFFSLSNTDPMNAIIAAGIFLQFAEGLQQL